MSNISEQLKTVTKEISPRTYLLVEAKLDWQTFKIYDFAVLMMQRLHEIIDQQNINAVGKVTFFYKSYTPKKIDFKLGVAVEGIIKNIDTAPFIYREIDTPFICECTSIEGSIHETKAGWLALQERSIANGMTLTGEYREVIIDFKGVESHRNIFELQLGIKKF